MKTTEPGSLAAAMIEPGAIGLLWIHSPPPGFEAKIDPRFVSFRFDPERGAAGLSAADAAAIEAAVTNAALGISNDTLAALPSLKFILSFGIGTDAVDLDRVRERGLTLCNTPVGDGQAVADHAMALLLAANRRICVADRFVRAGKWGSEPVPMSSGLAGRTCGIVGMGRIGSAIAVRAEAFGMKVAYMARTPKAHLSWPFYSEIGALAADADILILALPGARGAPPIVTSDVLARLGSKGILINVARGSLIDTTALVAALEQGAIEAAGLDVFDSEPNVPPRLCALENIVVTPHIAGFTYSNLAAVYDDGFAKLRAFASGQPLADRLA